MGPAHTPSETARNAATAVGIVLALLLCTAMWVYTSGWTTRAEAPQISREPIGPVVDKTGSHPTAAYAVDTSRSATAITATHRWGVIAYFLEVPIKATTSDARLPELVHVSAAVVSGGVQYICSEKGVPNPGTVQYPQRTILLNCAGSVDTTHVTAVDVYQPGGWLKQHVKSLTADHS